MKGIHTGKNTDIKKENPITRKQQDRKLPAENHLIDSKDKVSTFFVRNHAIHNFPTAPQITSTDCCAWQLILNCLKSSTCHHYTSIPKLLPIQTAQFFKTEKQMAVMLFSFTSSQLLIKLFGENTPGQLGHWNISRFQDNIRNTFIFFFFSNINTSHLRHVM